jgi:hypothetical protein
LGSGLFHKGDKDFSIVYGKAGFQPEGLIDPEIFLTDDEAAA